MDFTVMGPQDRLALEVCEAAGRVLQVAIHLCKGGALDHASIPFWIDEAERAWASAAIQLAKRERAGRRL